VAKGRERITTVVLSGGRGARLYPLTRTRSKASVSMGGKYRLIDIPLSNAINSQLSEIFVLTQFQSASLNAHIARTYRFDLFTDGLVEVLAAEQRDEGGGSWFAGTADAVRKHMDRFVREGVEHVLVLSGDHLYRMDYRELIAYHKAKNADITVSAIPIHRRDCENLGVMAVDSDGRVHAFREKPGAEEDLTALRTPPELKAAWGTDRDYLGSMGVYVFRAQVLREVLADPSVLDFGKDILPISVGTRHVAGFLFQDYWENIGTIKAFYDANLLLCEEAPPFRFYVPEAPIYTRARFLPPTIFHDTHVERSLVVEGSMLRGAHVIHSIIGHRAWLQGCHIEDSIVIGADFYEVGAAREKVVAKGRVPVGIGQGASIKRAILDKNARIGAGAVIHGSPDRPDEDHEQWSVRDGIIIVHKGALIPPGAVL
jgi:glucose-1-phosphate adenylyltransferase